MEEEKEERARGCIQKHLGANPRVAKKQERKTNGVIS
jgi:hypothetical protein